MDYEEQVSNLSRLMGFLDMPTVNYTSAGRYMVHQGYFLKIMGNLIHNRTADTFKFLFTKFQYFEKLVHHCYSRSITSILILILNVRKTLRLTELESMRSDKIFEEDMVLIRQEALASVAKLCIKTCDDPEYLETHLNSYLILVDAMENMESIQNGRAVIDWVLFDSNSKVFQQIVDLFLDTSHNSYGQIPELLNHVCATVKKIHGHTESSRRINQKSYLCWSQSSPQ